MHHPTDRIAHTTAFGALAGTRNSSMGPPHEGSILRGKSVHSWCDELLDRSFMVDPLSYFLFKPVLHDWCNKDCGMCYPVCGMMLIKEPLLLITKMWQQQVSSLAI